MNRETPWGWYAFWFVLPFAALHLVDGLVSSLLAAAVWLST